MKKMARGKNKPAAVAKRATTLSFSPPPQFQSTSNNNRYNSFKNRHLAVKRPYIIEKKTNIYNNYKSKYDNEFTLADNFLNKCKTNASKSIHNLNTKKQKQSVNPVKEDGNNDNNKDNAIANEIRNALTKYYAENTEVKEFVDDDAKKNDSHDNSNNNIEMHEGSSINVVDQTPDNDEDDHIINDLSNNVNNEKPIENIDNKSSEENVNVIMKSIPASIINKRKKPPIPSFNTMNNTAITKKKTDKMKKNNNTFSLSSKISNNDTKKIAKKTTQMLAYTCKDMCGQKHDVKELRDKRYRAVMKGIKFMQNFFRKSKYKALYAIGDDAPSIFFEMWYTSADSRVRSISKSLAVEFTDKLVDRLLKKKDKGIDEFFEAMFLLRIKKEMEMDCDSLLEMSYEIYSDKGFRDTDILFGVGKDQLDNVKTGPWLLLLMRILIMEYNKIIFQNKFPIQWGMKEAFIALRCHKLSLAGGDNFHDSFFLATHIVYALSAYNATKTLEKDVKWIWRYLRKALKYWLAQARLKEKEIKKAKDEGLDPPPFRYVDIDGIAEVVDVLRGCGLTEASDPMICQATICLLKMQQKQGDWPVYFNHGSGNMKNDKSSSYYDKVHPCWVTVQSLVAKGTFHNETYERWVKNVVRESNFDKLGYSAKWNMSSNKKKKMVNGNQSSKRNNKKKGGNKNVKNASSASSTYVVQTRSKPC